MKYLVKFTIITSTLFLSTVTSSKPTIKEKSVDVEEILSGNSILITNKFTPALFQFDSNYEFRGYNPNGDIVDIGVWRANGNSLCSTVTYQPLRSPTKIQKPKEFCMVIPSSKTSWSSVDLKNGVIKYLILDGKPSIDEAIKIIKK